MAKIQDKDQKHQEKDPKQQEKEKDQKRKNRKALVGRVEKVVKKSRRKLGEAKFEKELQRTIVFLEQLQATLGNSHAESSTATSKVAAKPSKKPAAKPLSAVPNPLSLKPAGHKAAVKSAKKVASSVKK